MKPKYSFELYGPNGALLADLAGRAKNRRIVLSRNEAEDIYWQLDLNDFEDYCRKAKLNPNELLVPGRTEVRVKRGSTYVCGGQVIWRQPRITPDSQDVEIRAKGFLNLFDSRYTGTTPAGSVQEVFTATEATGIAAALISQSQALAYGDFGVTIGTLATVGPHDRTYQSTNIKTALQNLTRVQVASFDFEFTPDKVFNTYAAIGSQRPEIVFSYPGNIKTLRSPLDATTIENEVTALGSGSSDSAAVVAVRSDLGSQASYALRQARISESSVLETGTLQDHADAELAAWAYPFELPVIEVNGNIAPFVTDYRIGDYVKVETSGYATLGGINAMYRVEMIDLQIDENDNETVMLTLSR